MIWSSSAAELPCFSKKNERMQDRVLTNYCRNGHGGDQQIAKRGTNKLPNVEPTNYQTWDQ